MSKKHPECPLYNHDNCREVDNPKFCALVREDKICLRKFHKTPNDREAREVSQLPADSEMSLP